MSLSAGLRSPVPSRHRTACNYARVYPVRRGPYAWPIAPQSGMSRRPGKEVDEIVRSSCSRVHNARPDAPPP